MKTRKWISLILGVTIALSNGAMLYAEETVQENTIVLESSSPEEENDELLQVGMIHEQESLDQAADLEEPEIIEGNKIESSLLTEYDLVKGSNYTSADAKYGSTYAYDQLTSENLKTAYDDILSYLYEIHDGVCEVSPVLIQDTYLLDKFDMSTYGIPHSDVDQLFNAIRNDHPELFWLEGAYYTYGNELSLAIYKQYTSPETIQSVKAQLAAVIKEYTDAAQDAGSEYEIEKIFHDKMVYEAMYDRTKTSLNNHNAAGILVDGVGVCESYAKSMQLLLNAVGIPNVYVTGKSNTGEGHAWNQIELNGDYYNVDVTWDDLDTQSIRGIRYTYFNRADEFFNKEHFADATIGVQTCTSEEYSYYNQNPEGIITADMISTSEDLHNVGVNLIKENLENDIYEMEIVAESNAVAAKLRKDLIANLTAIVNDPLIQGMVSEKCELSNIQFTKIKWEENFSIIFESKTPIAATDLKIVSSITSYTLNTLAFLQPQLTPMSVTNRKLRWTTSDSRVATVQDGVLTPQGNGTATITATTQDDAAISRQCKVTVSVPVQITGLTLPSTVQLYAIGSTKQIIPTITPTTAQNKELSWSSSNEGVVTVNSTGVVTAKEFGEALITARTTDGSAIQKTCKVVVAEGQKATSLSLSTNKVSVAEGSTVTLIASILPSNTADKTLTWTSSDEKIATVDEKGVVTAKAQGTATITAVTNDGSNLKAACEVTVTEGVKVTDIKLSKEAMNLLVNQSTNLTATVTPTNATNRTVTWQSSDESIATVSSVGKVTGIAEGRATITVTANDGSGKSATCSIWVTNELKVATLKLSSTSLSLVDGKEATLTATVTPSNAANRTLKWSSSNEKVLKVEEGRLITVAPGQATITVETIDGSELKATCDVTVTEGVKVTDIKLSKEEMNVLIGQSTSLTATVMPTNATNRSVSWQSSDEEIATVSSAGKITGIAEGRATITVTANDGSGKSATCNVWITKELKVMALKLSSTSLSLVDGKEATLTATVTPSNAANRILKWSSSNEKVLKVEEGQLTTVAPGEATITVETTDGSGLKAICDVTVTPGIKATDIKLSKEDLNILVGQSTSLTATVMPTNATNRSVTWASSNETVATVSSTGKITGVAEGKATITATAKDGSGKSANCSVWITNELKVATLKLSETSLSMAEGKAVTLTATMTPTNAANRTLKWSSSDEAVLKVEEGKLTTVAPGEATITAETTDGSGLKATCDVKVTAGIKVEGMKLSKEEMNLLVGQSISLTATITPTTATNSTVTWQSSDEQIVTVNNRGVLKGISEGRATITATTNDGSGKSATCNIWVTKEIKIATLKLSSTSLTIVDGKEATLTTTVTPSNVANRTLKWSSSNEEVLTVEEGKITTVAPGEATVTVETMDGSNLKATCDVTVTAGIKITEVRLSKEEMNVLVGKTISLTATVLPGNATNRSVTWTSSDEKIVTVSSAGKLTGVAEGKATITVAANDGSGKSATCNVWVTKELKVMALKLSKTELTIIDGKEATLTTTITPTNAANRTLKWSSSNEKVLKVEEGKITTVAPGEATVTVETTDGSDLKATCDVTVTAGVKATGIKLSKDVLNVLLGKTASLTATVIPTTATNRSVTWTSSDEKIATVSSVGKITGIAEGKAMITATTNDGTEKSATCSVWVTKELKVIALKLRKEELTIVDGKEITLTTTVTPTNAANRTLKWSSSNEKVLKVEEGKITTVAPGEATVTVETTDGSDLKATCDVTVTKGIKVTSIKFNKDEINVVIGKPVSLTATVLPSNATKRTLTWTSSDEGIATVSSAGKVTGITEGRVTITATATDGSGKTATCSIWVTKEAKVTVLKLSQTTLNLTVGKEATLKAISTPTTAANQVVLWKSSDESVAIVENGKVTAFDAGKTTITATTTDGSNLVASCNVTVK